MVYPQKLEPRTSMEAESKPQRRAGLYILERIMVELTTNIQTHVIIGLLSSKKRTPGSRQFRKIKRHTSQ